MKSESNDLSPIDSLYSSNLQRSSSSLCRFKVFSLRAALRFNLEAWLLEPSRMSSSFFTFVAGISMGSGSGSGASWRWPKRRRKMLQERDRLVVGGLVGVGGSFSTSSVWSSLKLKVMLMSLCSSRIENDEIEESFLFYLVRGFFRLFGSAFVRLLS